MSENTPVFKGKLTDIETVDIEVPLSEVSTKSCSYYSSAYGKRANTAEESGNDAESNVFRFLATLTSFFPNYSDVANPYQPMSQFEGKRSLVPSDLQVEDYPGVRALADKSSDPALKARLLDILWMGQNNHTDCKDAVSSYLEAAKVLDTEENWNHSTDLYYRALQLAKRLGWKQSPYLTAEAQLLEAIERDSETETGFRTCYLLEYALEFHCGEHQRLAKIAGGIGDRASEAKEHRNAREYWTLQAKFSSQDQSTAQGAFLKAAETYVSEAEERATGSKWAAATILKDGIEALRRAGADPERIQELKAWLLQLQEASTDELHTFEHKIDISESVKGAREHVSGYSLAKALVRLAFGQPTVDLTNLKQSVLDAIKKFPLSHLFNSTQMDEKGRTRIETEGFDFAQAGDNEKQIEAKMFEEFGRTHVTVRSQAYIRPAQEQIYNEHHPQANDLIFLVANNPFVPPHHEAIFLRGLHAGLCGDYLVAAHLLVPQIENSIRYVLESEGVDVSNLKADGTQPVKMFGGLFGLEATKQIFDDSLCFELRGLLIEKTACDFRNRLAHGFVTEGECYGDAAINIWWIVLILCITPIVNSKPEANES